MDLSVGIVFAPTLNIPAPLISIFLTDFDAIFAARSDNDSPEPMPADAAAQASNFASSEPLRSPRQQTFTDQSAPAYNQSNYAQNSVSGYQSTGQNLNGGPVQRNTYALSQSQQPPHDFAPPQQSLQQNLQQQQQYSAYIPQPGQYNMYNPYGPPSGVDGASLGTMSSRPSSSHYNSTNGSLGVNPDSKRSRRESAMMGMNYGLVGQRPPGRQTLHDTSNPRQ
jgi:RalA-binding protein 1